MTTETTNIELTKEQKLQVRAEKLKQQLAKAQKQLSQIRTKQQTEARRKRTRKLINVGAIFDMVNHELIETEANSTLFRLVLGAALQLNELLKVADDSSKQRLATVEAKAKQFLDNRDKDK